MLGLEVNAGAGGFICKQRGVVDKGGRKLNPPAPRPQPRVLAQTTCPRLRSSEALLAIRPWPRAPHPQTVSMEAPPLPPPSHPGLRLSHPPWTGLLRASDYLPHQTGGLLRIRTVSSVSWGLPEGRRYVSPSHWEITDAVSAHSDRKLTRGGQGWVWPGLFSLTPMTTTG